MEHLILSPFSHKNVTNQTFMSKAAIDSKEQKIGKNFEEIFFRNCLEVMFPGSSSNSLLGGGFGENIYRGFLNDCIAKKITDGGGIGIAPLIVKELTIPQRFTYQRTI